MAVFDVKLENYEGPVELLVHLVEINKMDIYDIQISVLTTQYMQYLKTHEYADMEQMSAFLLMAAELVEIKSAMLLPSWKDGGSEEEDPRERLVRQLIIYKHFKGIAESLREKRQTARLFLWRKGGGHAVIPDRPINTEKLLNGISYEFLEAVYKDIVRRRELSVDTVRSDFGRVRPDMFPVNDKMNELRAFLQKNGSTGFRVLLESVSCKDEAVSLFLAVLELIKTSEIAVSQRKNYDDFVLKWSV